jgi:hypothetical protein
MLSTEENPISLKCQPDFEGAMPAIKRGFPNYNCRGPVSYSTGRRYGGSEHPSNLRVRADDRERIGAGEAAEAQRECSDTEVPWRPDGECGGQRRHVKDCVEVHLRRGPLMQAFRSDATGIEGAPDATASA